MVVPLNNSYPSIEVFDRRWLHVPTHTRHSGNQLIVVALLAPFLDPLFVRLTIKHERVEWSRYVAFVLSTNFLVSLVMWPIGPSHHVSNWHLIVFCLNAQRLLEDELCVLLLAFFVPFCSR